jgi:hypothetical protein
VTPSQGSHFFQNIAAGNVVYFTVNPDAGDGFVDWEWLRDQPAVAETELVRHLRFACPVVIAINAGLTPVSSGSRRRRPAHCSALFLTRNVAEQTMERVRSSPRVIPSEARDLADSSTFGLGMTGEWRQLGMTGE